MVGQGLGLSFPLHFSIWREDAIKKVTGHKRELQQPRTKLLLLLLRARQQNPTEPGVKSNISAALGYKSDGHFHYDWNYLINAGMLEEKQGHFLVTDTGKKEFALYSTAAMNNWIIVIMGAAMLAFTVGINFGVLPKESIAFFGAALIFIGAMFLMIGRRTNQNYHPKQLSY